MNKSKNKNTQISYMNNVNKKNNKSYKEIYHKCNTEKNNANNIISPYNEIFYIYQKKI